MKRIARLLQSLPEKLLAIAAVCFVWELLPRIGAVSEYILPPFSTVLAKLAGMLASGEILPHIGYSLNRSLLGFLVSLAAGVPFGFLMAWSKRVERLLDPVMQLMRNTPTLALYPVFILVLGLGEFSKVGIIFWGTVWPILLNTTEGVRTVDPLYIKSARSMGSSALTLLVKVILPAALPSIFTGIRLGASRSIIILVGAEMLGADKGLGFLVFSSEQNYKVAEMYSGILTLVILGVLINYGLVRWEKRITRWKQDIAGA